MGRYVIGGGRDRTVITGESREYSTGMRFDAETPEQQPEA